MTKYFIILFICLSAAACAKKAIPSAIVKSSDKTEESKPADTKTDIAKTNSDIQAKAEIEKAQAAIPDKAGQKPSEEESGRMVYATKCTRCHAAKNVSSYTFGQWESILKKMVPNAKLSNDEESQVVAYIKANSK